MKRITLSIHIVIIFLSISFISCGPDEPAPQIHKLVTDVTGPAPVIYRCCYGPGTDCAGIWWEVMKSANFKSYVENNEIGRYFQEEEWQRGFPELVGREEDIVSQIIATNPKGIFLGTGDDEIFVLLKDPNLPYSKENILYTFVQRISDDPCPGYPGS
jgi:hypothetical protein